MCCRLRAAKRRSVGDEGATVAAGGGCAGPLPSSASGHASRVDGGNAKKRDRAPSSLDDELTGLESYVGLVTAAH